ncbi:MAG: trehalose-6-phosphate synthase, partial [Bacteroidota bacterium]
MDKGAIFFKLTKNKIVSQLMESNKTIIVSNRLPLQISKEENSYKVVPSVGGLATGMKSVHAEGNGIWIGWSGITENDLEGEEKNDIEAKIKAAKCVSVSLTEEDINDYYLGFSNKAL